MSEPGRLSGRRVLVASGGPGQRVRLAEAEARHLVAVLRARPGDAVSAVDPAGDRFRAVVASVDGSGVWLAIEDRLETAQAFAPGPALIVAPPKGSRMDWLVEKTVELGAGRIVPVATRRGVRRAAGEAQAERWRRVAAAAVKQSGAAPPEVSAMRPLEEALRGMAGILLAAHPVPSSEPFEAVLPAIPEGHVPAFAIGPEGGWDESEIRLLEGASARFVWLGRRTLRTETAAVAVLACWALSRRG